MATAQSVRKRHVRPRQRLKRNYERGPRKMPSKAFFETRSENAVSALLHFWRAWALEKWRGILPRTGRGARKTRKERKGPHSPLIRALPRASRIS